MPHWCLGLWIIWLVDHNSCAYSDVCLTDRSATRELCRGPSCLPPFSLSKPQTSATAQRPATFRSVLIALLWLDVLPAVMSTEWVQDCGGQLCSVGQGKPPTVQCDKDEGTGGELEEDQGSGTKGELKRRIGFRIVIASHQVPKTCTCTIFELVSVISKLGLPQALNTLLLCLKSLTTISTCVYITTQKGVRSYMTLSWKTSMTGSG